MDGAVTFHKMRPKLTRILVVLEYHPQGMFERTDAADECQEAGYEDEGPAQ